jgi:small nuclear ribonucleoprotein (snRNP)-like protein
MGRTEVSYYPPGLRRLPQEEVHATEIETLLSSWIRVVLVDGRVFVGSLKAIDSDRNLVLMNAAEVRSVKIGETKEEKEEKKAHRGYCMINSRHIVSIGKRKQ